MTRPPRSTEMMPPATPIRLRFQYDALRPDGSTERGVVHASDVAEVQNLLAGRRLFPTNIRPASSRFSSSPTSSSASDIAQGLRTLSTLLEAGLPVSRALWAFADVAPAPWQRSVPDLQQSVREGHSLTSALRTAHLGVPEVMLGIIGAGEAGGDVSSAVARAADLADRDAALRQSIRSALAYPALLTVVAARESLHNDA